MSNKKPTSPPPKPAARPRCMYRVVLVQPRCTYRGVRRDSCGKWIAEIREPNRGARLFLGTFTTSIEAAATYDTAARALYGPNAELNLPGLWLVQRRPNTPAHQKPGSD